MRNFREAVLSLVARIPEGQVATYGQIALMAGFPRRPRQVGIAARGRFWGALAQADRLRAEGVAVDQGGLLDLEAHRWNGEFTKAARNR
ncbi:MAG: Methylated-DNA--protein-cysteine methyltransferase [Acidobacteria bacterium ADurb.Bin340]|nr:MAG: Methylated-DNA--protein-cysteine methyltransferase [Acidobacteria bacterium ADurb.Bin340]